MSQPKKLPDWAYDYTAAALINLKDASDALADYMVHHRLSGAALTDLIDVKTRIDMARSPFLMMDELQSKK